jgi:hypothetical protein
MRTRRSPKNQDRLFKALFPKPEAITEKIVLNGCIPGDDIFVPMEDEE